ncbi:MAG TPA: nucleotidyltransferase substrate binding protein [Byssovorax sp.]|jgi:nucleotidyltransferase substrate binding protein (TIGR01987 family)
MPNPDIRWKQRFQNFDRAFVLLRDGLASKPLVEFSDLEREGLIQRFEFTFELAWKVLKDFLEESGVVITPVTPREVLKSAFTARLVDDGQVWIDMMLDRTRLSHVYSFEVFTSVLEEVGRRYLPALDLLHDAFFARSLAP